MASVLAEAVVGKVCEMAVQQVANEISIVSNFTEDFEWLKNRIEEINGALNEAAEESSRQKQSAKKWLHRVRDIAWEAEDILEECSVDSFYATNTQSCTLGCHQLFLRHKMGRRIQKVKARLRSVVEEGNQLNIVRATAAVPRREEAESSSSSQGQQFRRSSLLPRDSYPVGIESKIESMVSLLENPLFPIIAVVGMGGIGKTHLLQNIYNRVKGRYEISAWLSVSQFDSVSKLQGDLASSLGGLSAQIKEGGVSEQQAAEFIHGFLLGKKYLIVLDDVWRATREDDLIARIGLPVATSANGESTLLVSTRSKEVCTNFNAHIYEMEYLTDKDSWMLFCAYAFSRCEGNRAPQHLEEVGRVIVKECGKLPLAIITTAASLTKTTLPRHWQSKLSKLKKVSTPSDSIMDILKLSYDSLPAHLRDCFAYLSFFPEDERIECEYLIHLWKGEGFIPAGQNPWDCLDQLANLCLVEVWEDEGLRKYCKIHDLLLDLAILICKENKCAFDVEDAFPKLCSVNTGGGRWCRFFWAKKGIDEHAISQRRPVSPTLVRTLSLSSNTEIKGNIPGMLFSGMRVLRVLDLSSTNISTLPACVGEMKLLKVLNLSWTRIQKLPECVRHLRSLSYLNVSIPGHKRVEAPKWISELRCLEHLEGGFKRMPKGIIKLESLRTMRCMLSLSVEEDGGLRLEDIGKMRGIEEIGYAVSHKSQLRRVEEGILAPLLNMRRLKVSNDIDGMQSGLPQFPESMSAMTNLESLLLYCFVVPRWIRCLENLRYLFLHNSDCSDSELQSLPSLVSLQLYGKRRCREVPKAFGKSGGFPHLRFFTIFGLSELEEFPEMEDGAMPCLEKLEILYCQKLNKVGEGLERLKRLKEIKIVGSSDVLREALKEGGIYWKRIKDVNPQISIKVSEW